MKKIKVVVADDSVVYRSQIRSALQNMPQVEIVAAVAHGRLAIERLCQAPVDLLILDLEMPEMDGLQTLTEMKNRQLTSRVLVFSSASKRGADITLEALQKGASDFIAKPGPADFNVSAGQEPGVIIEALLRPKIQALFPEAFQESVKHNTSAMPTVYSPVNWDLFQPAILVIGSSTGGPTVLEKIFSQIQGPLNVPIVVAQHMPPVFTASLAERLGKISGLPSAEAVDGQKLEKNRIYVAPGGYHLTLRQTEAGVLLRLDQSEPVHFVRPAVDPLFSSAAEIFKQKCWALVLTGMGADGRDGAVAIKSRGGAVWIQDEASCVVYGMPGAVQGRGAFDQIASPNEMIAGIRAKLQNQNQKPKETRSA